VARIDYTSSYAGIKRLDQKRIITIYSNVLSGYSANDIVPVITREARNFKLHEGTNIKLTGEQEDQAQTAEFLLKAMIIALGAIFFILITQFGSVMKSLIILSEVLFSIIGVLLGVMLFHMNLVIMMIGNCSPGRYCRPERNTDCRIYRCQEKGRTAYQTCHH